MENVLNEYGVIGSLLIDATLFPEASGLSEDDFTLVPLREVFRAMRRQFSENGGFDALTIRTEAGQHCPEVTDALLMKTLEITPTAANLSAYTAAVKEASLGRKRRSTYRRSKALCRQIRPRLANRTERRQIWGEGCLCLA